MSTYFAKYLHILCQVSPHTLPSISTYFAKYLHILCQVSPDQKNNQPNKQQNNQTTNHPTILPFSPFSSENKTVQRVC